MKIKRSIRFFFQRIFRGWDDSETWSLDYPIAKFILPRLKRFKELNDAFPLDTTPESWDEELDEMIWCFNFMITQRDWGRVGADFGTKEEWERSQKGLELFAKRYFDLWW